MVFLGTRSVGLAAAVPIFFIDEQNESNGPPWGVAERLQDAQDFECVYNASAVVVGAFPDVPRVEVTPQRDDFIGQFASAPLADDIALFHVGESAAIHFQHHFQVRVRFELIREPAGVHR